MPIRLLALDLDGTLIDRKQRLHPEHVRAVRAARQAGLEVIIVTGRSWRGAREYYEALEMTGPAILYLGALEVAGPDGRVAYYRPLEQQTWEAVRDYAVSRGLAVTACAGADQQAQEVGRMPALAADVAFATCVADDFDDWHGWNPYTEVVDNLPQRCPAAPVMVACYGDRSVAQMLEAFPRGLPGAQFDLSDRIKGETVLHIWHESIDKGRALARFCAQHGFRPEEVCAMGDSTPDVSMMRFAGLAVAMPDSRPAVMQAATWHSAEDDPHPVATAIDRILRAD